MNRDSLLSLHQLALGIMEDPTFYKVLRTKLVPLNYNEALELLKVYYLSESFYNLKNE